MLVMEAKQGARAGPGEAIQRSQLDAPAISFLTGVRPVQTQALSTALILKVAETTRYVPTIWARAARTR